MNVVRSCAAFRPAVGAFVVVDASVRQTQSPWPTFSFFYLFFYSFYFSPWEFNERGQQQATKCPPRQWHNVRQSQMGVNKNRLRKLANCSYLIVNTNGWKRWEVVVLRLSVDRLERIDDAINDTLEQNIPASLR